MFVDEYSFTQSMSSFFVGVYGWMSAGLMITSATAYYVASNPVLFAHIFQPTVVIGLIFMQLLFVISLSFFITRMSFFFAALLFGLYACSLGLTLSSIFYVYTQASIISTFLCVAAMFGAMSLYGYYTRTDLTRFGNILMMMLMGLIIGTVINAFMHNEQLDYIMSAVGVVIFTLLTAYDTQKIKEMARVFFAKNEPLEKITLIGALILYLDFVNLFLFMMRFMGKRTER